MTRIDENPYEAPQSKSERRPKRANYDPLQLTRKLTRVWWIVAAIVASLAAASLVFG